MRFKMALSMIVCSLGMAAMAHADNIALNKPVTLEGTYGVIRSPSSWPDATTYPVAAASTITDGIFRGDGTEWQDGTVWWDASQQQSAGNAIIVDLQGLYQITGLAIEADNNDRYEIEYHDVVADVWQPWVYANLTNSNGLWTRSGALGPIETDKFRIYGFDGDQYYSVSEFQAEGTAIPLPAALPSGLLLTIGCIAGHFVRRRRAAL